MQLAALTQAYLLQALGFAIVNSFWQTGLLWLLYRLITATDKKMPALVRYHLSMVLLLVSFFWFAFTITSSYLLLKDNEALPLQLFANSLLLENKMVDTTLPLLSLFYFVCLVFYAIQFCKNLLANHFLQTKGLTKAPVDFRLFSNHVALHLGIQKKVQVWLSAYVTVPSVTGFIKPAILLPAAITTHLSIQQVEAILLHELAHIKRHDYLLNLIQSFTGMILFFNPFANWLGRVARIERENCCDDWVINYKYNRRQYAEALIILEENRHQSSDYPFTLAATNNKNNLLHRVKRLFIITPKTSLSGVNKISFAALILLLCVLMLTIKPAVITHKNKTVAAVNKARLNLFKYGSFANERMPAVILKSNPADLVAAKSKPSKKPKAVISRLNGVEKEDFVNTYINEEILKANDHQPEELVTNVVEREPANTKYFVKVEEQQSGKKQTNTYYLELNNIEGAVTIKPLMILNKIKISVRKPITKSINDSLPTPAKPLKKKRITS